MSLKMLRELTKATSRVWRAGEVSSGYQRADGNLKIKKEKRGSNGHSGSGKYNH